MKRALFELMLCNNPELFEQLKVPSEILDRGACVGADPVIFDGESLGAIKTAKKICGGCPIVDKCLSWAVANESHGVWGGKTPEERQVMSVSASVLTLDERIKMQELRSDLLSDLTAEEVAKRHEVTTRTVFRWRARLSQSVA